MTTGHPMYLAMLADGPRGRQGTRDYPGRMTSPTASTSDVVDLLALVAHLEATAFLRLAGAAAAAPEPEQRLYLSRMAGATLARQERVLTELGRLDAAQAPEARMFTFDHVFDDYEARTAPSSWWEEIMKSYVGHGVAEDFCRIVVDAVDPQTRAIVCEVLDGGSASAESIELVAAAARQDEVLAARLALWGRRLVGEAMSVVQSLLVENAFLMRLLEAAIVRRDGEQVALAEPGTTPDAVPEDRAAWLFSQLTAAHTRRMERLGLAA